MYHQLNLPWLEVSAVIFSCCSYYYSANLIANVISVLAASHASSAVLLMCSLIAFCRAQIQSAFGEHEKILIFYIC